MNETSPQTDPRTMRDRVLQWVDEGLDGIDEGRLSEAAQEAAARVVREGLLSEVWDEMGAMAIAYLWRRRNAARRASAIAGQRVQEMPTAPNGPEQALLPGANGAAVDAVLALPRLKVQQPTGQRRVNVRKLSHALLQQQYYVAGQWRRLQTLVRADLALVIGNYRRQASDCHGLATFLQRVHDGMAEGQTVGQRYSQGELYELADEAKTKELVTE